MTTPDDLLAEADAWSLEDGLVRRLAAAMRAEQERARLLSLALAVEQARSANRAASLEAVREALGDAAGQAGTLAEDVAALRQFALEILELYKPIRKKDAAPEPALVHRFLDLLGTASEDELDLFRETPEAARLRALLTGRKEV